MRSIKKDWRRGTRKGDLRYMNMDIIAKRIVKEYVEEHLDKSDKDIKESD